MYSWTRRAASGFGWPGGGRVARRLILCGGTRFAGLGSTMTRQSEISRQVGSLSALLVCLLVLGGGMGVREAWGIVGGAAPDAADTRFDCVGAVTKSDFGTENSRGSCVLVAPNVVLTARHVFNSCGTLPSGCTCHNDWIEDGEHHMVRFRRLPNQNGGPGGPVGTPGTEQFEVGIDRIIFPDIPNGANCAHYDFAICILESNVNHIEPAVIDYSEIHDPPDNNPLGTLNQYGEFWIAGWGQNASFQLPGSLLVAPMQGRCARFGPSSSGWTGDSGGAVLCQGSCDRMRLVGIIQTPSEAGSCYRIPASLRALIPAPPACTRQVTTAFLPDPIVRGRVTATAAIPTSGVPPNQTFNEIPSSGWYPCSGGIGQCADGVSRGTSAGLALTFDGAEQCRFSAYANCSGDGWFALRGTDEVLLDFNIESSHHTGALRLIGGGPSPLNLDADSAIGCPTNSQPFEAEIPLEVLGPKTAIVRVQASGRIQATFGPLPPPAPIVRPSVIDDVRTTWDLFSDTDASGSVTPIDDLIGGAQCNSFQTFVQSPIPFALRLRSFEVAPGRYVLRVKQEVDVSLKATVKACEPEETAGAPSINVRLMVKLIVDSY